MQYIAFVFMYAFVYKFNYIDILSDRAVSVSAAVSVCQKQNGTNGAAEGEKTREVRLCFPNE